MADTPTAGIRLFIKPTCRRTGPNSKTASRLFDPCSKNLRPARARPPVQDNRFFDAARLGCDAFVGASEISGRMKIPGQSSVGRSWPAALAGRLTLAGGAQLFNSPRALLQRFAAVRACS